MVALVKNHSYPISGFFGVRQTLHFDGLNLYFDHFLKKNNWKARDLCVYLLIYPFAKIQIFIIQLFGLSNLGEWTFGITLIHLSLRHALSQKLPIQLF